MRYALLLSLIAWSFFCFGTSAALAERSPITLSSPNGELTVTIEVGQRVTWSVIAHGTPVLAPSPIGMTLEGSPVIGKNARVVGVTTSTVDRILHPTVKLKRAVIRDWFNECRIDFDGRYRLVVRAYDDGVAYRWATSLPDSVTVVDELATFRFPEDALVYFPEETSLISHQEQLYQRTSLADIADTSFSGVPVLVQLNVGPKVVITEADLFDYPGMDLTRDPDQFGLRGLFPRYPTVVQMDSVRADRTELVRERAPWIARTNGHREFPWRVLVVADADRMLLETDIVYRLASETKLTDTSWIKPGKVQWDWWNANNLYGVPFRAGINTTTYLHYIDFAADHGIPYVILDEGWYVLGNLTNVAPEIDMERLAAHARVRNVGLILWVAWKTFDDQMEAALDEFDRWGIKGVKIDFMQREDQWMVNFYERAAKAAAEHHVLVDFHGSYKPTGLYRTYPNVLTSEGVRGLEHNKWSDSASPDNAVTFPFIRMLAGPVDYTPGAMLNAAKPDFVPVFNRPMSQGTRCQQLAMYVVYESPLQMLADSPSNYLREPECLSFLQSVPTVWDETRVIDAAVGDYIVTARRTGTDWYIGAITNWDARDILLDCSFLGECSFTASIFSDGPNADRVGVDFVYGSAVITGRDLLAIHCAPGGGWIARLEPR
jgi:alpha-glucosidase